MDVSLFDSRVARDVTEPPRMAASPGQDTRSQESFADHLQTESPVVTHDSAHDETQPVDVEEVPADERASAEDQEPEPVDETAVRNDTITASVQPASTTQSQPATAEQPQTASAADPQSPHSTQPATASTADVLPAASSGVEALQPEKSAAQAAAAPVVTQQRTGHPASLVTAASEPAAVQRQATAATAPQVESVPGAGPGTGGLSPANEQAVIDLAARSAEELAGKKNGKKTAEKTGAKSRATGDSGPYGESPTLSVAKPDSVDRTVEELSLASRAIDALEAKPSPGAERTDTASATAGKEVAARVDANGRVSSFSERLPDQLFGRNSSGAATSQEITQPDQLRLVQRVARAIEAAPQRGGLLRLRLRPPELGAVRLEVLLERGNLVARIETETQQARNVLLEHLPQLRDRLTAQGIHVEQFDVDVSSRDSSETPFQSHDSEDSLPPLLARRRAAAVSESSAEIHRSPDLSVYSSPGKLNVVI